MSKLLKLEHQKRLEICPWAFFSGTGGWKAAADAHDGAAIWANTQQPHALIWVKALGAWQNIPFVWFIWAVQETDKADFYIFCCKFKKKRKCLFCCYCSAMSQQIRIWWWWNKQSLTPFINRQYGKLIPSVFQIILQQVCMPSHKKPASQYQLSQLRIIYNIPYI